MKTALVFSVAHARLGLDISHVEEVLPLVQLVKPPEMPKILRGFINVGGALVPVIRLESLLRLNTGSTPWAPELDLSSTIIVADLSGLKVAWMAASDANILTYAVSETVRLPSDHVLNNCAEQVVARTPPEPSIVLLDPARLLLENERVRLAELQNREQERIAALT